MKTTTATDTRIKTTPTMCAILVAALDANNRVCIPSHAEGYKGRGTAIKGLRERGYVHNVPADVEGCFWPTLTPAGIEKARALRAAIAAK